MKLRHAYISRAILDQNISKMTTANTNAAKNWVFTINNYTENDEMKLETMFEHGHFNYIVYGREIGEQNGTPHLQGYVQFKKKLRLAQARTFISPRARLDISRGSPDMASRYCKMHIENETEQVRKTTILLKRVL